MAVQSVFYGSVQPAYVSSVTYSIPYTNPDTGITVDTIPLVWPTPYATSPLTIATTTNLTVTVAGGAILLPNANEVSLGTAVYIRNNPGSTETLEVKTSTGVDIVTIDAGQVYFVQLVAYTTDTTSGTWDVILMGSGTSAATAAELAGQGLEAVSNKLNTVTIPNIITADHTITEVDESSLLVVNSTGIITITVPEFRGGFSFSVNNVGTGLVQFSGITVNNTTDFSIQSSQTLTLIEDSTNLANWWSLGLGQATAYLSSVVSINICDYSNAGGENLSTGGTLILSDIQVSAFIIQIYAQISGINQEITGDISLYFGNRSSNWYIANFCTTNNGSTISLVLGTPTVPIGSPNIIAMGAQLIYYSANNPNTGTLLLSTIPSILNLNKLFFDSGTLTYNALDPTTTGPSVTFTDDPTSGMYLPAAFTPTIATNGVNALQVINTTGTSSIARINSSSAGTNYLNLGATATTGFMSYTNALYSSQISIENTATSSTFNFYDVLSDSIFAINTSANKATLTWDDGNTFLGTVNLNGTANSTTLNLQSTAATTTPILSLSSTSTNAVISFINNLYTSNFTINNNGTTSTFSLTDVASSSIFAANVSTGGCTLTLSTPTSNFLASLFGTSVSSSFSILSETVGNSLIFTANTAAAAAITYAGNTAISISTNGTVTFPAQNTNTRNALLPTVSSGNSGNILYWANNIWTTSIPSNVFGSGVFPYWNGSILTYSSAPSNNCLSYWDQTTLNWVNSTSPTTAGQILTWNGSAWVPTDAITLAANALKTAGQILPNAPTGIGSMIYWNGSAWDTINAPATAGSMIYWNGSAWDTINAPKEPNQILLWNGSAWDTIAAPKEIGQILLYVGGSIRWY